MLAGCAAPPQREPAREPGGPTTEAIANATYRAGLLQGTPVTLRDGRYERGDGVVVWLLPAPVARGLVAGKPSAVVLIAESGGGSGTFISLALVQDVDGRAVEVASTLLGDRPRVQGLALGADGLITVDLVQVGPSDAFCCPTMPMSVDYAFEGGRLVVRGLSSAEIDARGYAEGVNAFVVQPTAYDRSLPPSGQGEPKHFAWTFDGDQAVDTARGHVAVYPLAAYRAIWREAGDGFVERQLAALTRLLDSREASPAVPLPVLPQRGGFNDLAAQVRYLELPGGGRGVRFVGRFSQDAAPLLNRQLRYVFQGLSADGETLFVTDLPVSATGVPEAVEETGPDIVAYLARWRATLEGLSGDDFSPGLAALDALVTSVEVNR
jgi:hypothetical protein